MCLDVLSVLEKGTEIVDSVHAKQERYAARKAEKVGKVVGDSRPL